MALTQRAELWRFGAAVGGRRSISRVRGEIPCLVVPISGADRLPEYARMASAVVVLPAHLVPDVDVRPQDELHIGRVVDREEVTARRYTIVGLRRFDFPERLLEALVQEPR